MAVKVLQQFVLVSLLSLFLTGCGDNEVLSQNEPAPSFQLTSIDGQSATFPQQFEGRVVLVSFWADWCQSCYQEMRDFEKLYQQYKNQGLSILAINIKQDRETALAFIEGLNLSYPILLDSNGDVAEKYSVSQLPIAFVMDRQGRLKNRLLGEAPPEIFEKLVQSLM